MAKPKPVWFLPRTRTDPPIDAIRLGDIVASPFDPEEAINGDSPPPVPTTLLRRVEQPDWSWTKEFARSNSGGVFAQFLQIVGAGTDLDLSHSKSRKDIYNAERLVTEYFIPNQRYIEEALKDDDVKSALTGPNRRSRVFMITGIMVAYGATKAMEVMRSNDIHAQFSVNLGPFTGAPVSVGPKGGTSSSTTENLSAGKSDFVFGLQVREIRYKKGEVVHREYNKGSLYAGRKDEHLKDDEGGVDEIDFAELDIEETSLADLEGVRSRTIDAGGDEAAVNYVFP